MGGNSMRLIFGLVFLTLGAACAASTTSPEAESPPELDAGPVPTTTPDAHPVPAIDGGHSDALAPHQEAGADAGTATTGDARAPQGEAGTLDAGAPDALPRVDVAVPDAAPTLDATDGAADIDAIVATTFRNFGCDPANAPPTCGGITGPGGGYAMVVALDCAPTGKWVANHTGFDSHGQPLTCHACPVNTLCSP
jgi:hypothetical protein